MLKGIRGVRLNNRKVLRAPGPRTKCFERYSFSFNKIIVEPEEIKKKIGVNF